MTHIYLTISLFYTQRGWHTSELCNLHNPISNDKFRPVISTRTNSIQSCLVFSRHLMIISARSLCIYLLTHKHLVSLSLVQFVVKPDTNITCNSSLTTAIILTASYIHVLESFRDYYSLHFYKYYLKKQNALNTVRYPYRYFVCTMTNKCTMHNDWKKEAITINWTQYCLTWVFLPSVHVVF